MWDERFLCLATHISQWSKDPSTKVGAVLVGADKRQVALGYNGFPPGVADTEFRLTNRVAKLRYMQHAERNVLDNAAFPTQGATLYVTHPPCCACALSIVSKGIRRVVSLPMSSDFAARWGADVYQTREIFRESGVAFEG
jgi:dCMP deaminase